MKLVFEIDLDHPVVLEHNRSLELVRQAFADATEGFAESFAHGYLFFEEDPKKKEFVFSEMSDTDERVVGRISIVYDPFDTTSRANDEDAEDFLTRQAGESGHKKVLTSPRTKH